MWKGNRTKIFALILLSSFVFIAILRYFLMIRNRENACKFDSEQFYECIPLVQNDGTRYTNDRVLKIVVMTKDDWPLSRAWALYHGFVFGVHNLYIIDGSTDPRQKMFLTYLKALGFNVLFSQAGLDKLETVITRLMHALRKSCDFLMKLDTDEFLALYNPSTRDVYTSHTLIQAHLNALPYNGSMYKVGFYADSIPRVDDCNPEEDITSTTTQFTCPSASQHKSFFPSTTFKHMDLGSHGGVVSVTGPGKNIFHSSNLVILHYHNRCFLSVMRSCETVVISHGYIYQNDSTAKRIEKLEAKGASGYNSFHKAVYYLHYLRDPAATEKAYYDMIRSGRDNWTKCNITAVQEVNKMIL